MDISQEIKSVMKEIIKEYLTYNITIHDNETGDKICETFCIFIPPMEAVFDFNHNGAKSGVVKDIYCNADKKVTIYLEMIEIDKE